MAISSRREVPRLLLVVAGVQIPLLDASRNGQFTRYNLLTAEIQGFAENDKVHGCDPFFISCQSWNYSKSFYHLPKKQA
jgi:hypothetical protein